MKRLCVFFFVVFCPVVGAQSSACVAAKTLKGKYFAQLSLPNDISAIAQFSGGNVTPAGVNYSGTLVTNDRQGDIKTTPVTVLLKYDQFNCAAQLEISDKSGNVLQAPGILDRSGFLALAGKGIRGQAWFIEDSLCADPDAVANGSFYSSIVEKSGGAIARFSLVSLAGSPRVQHYSGYVLADGSAERLSVRLDVTGPACTGTLTFQREGQAEQVYPAVFDRGGNALFVTPTGWGCTWGDTLEDPS